MAASLLILQPLAVSLVQQLKQSVWHPSLDHGVGDYNLLCPVGLVATDDHLVSALHARHYTLDQISAVLEAFRQHSVCPHACCDDASVLPWPQSLIQALVSCPLAGGVGVTFVTRPLPS